MFKGKIKLLATSLALTLGVNTYAATGLIPLDIEEQRIAKIEALNIDFIDSDFIREVSSQWQKVSGFYQAKRQLETLGNQLWLSEKTDIKNRLKFDDRPLYWQRLAVKRLLKENPKSFSKAELARLLEVFENTSRGYSDIDFISTADKQIFITGFDPFLLDKNIEQSNPSGLAALTLDGKIIEVDGKLVEINAVIVPVRYGDFDHGEIETLLAPIYLAGKVDLVATISMGREHFDLERFPGKRRSVTAPDNLNQFSGGDKEAPVIAKLAGDTLTGSEFVEFSLPAAAMQKVKGQYQVIDNRKVVSLEKGELQPKSLDELQGLTAVSGGGGGYLSNEISYRSIRLKQQLGIDVPTGHIHTPRVKTFDNANNQAIIAQIEAMLIEAAKTL